jgi:hypothetical protein
LARNKRLEVLERAVKGSVQGSVVAAIDGEDIRKGALKGLGYGALSAPLLIWVFGVRYNPLRDWSEKQIDDMIKNENDFQNLVGRGGEYKIDRQLILDAQYRVNGQLPEWIRASITLPGNVSMHSRHFSALEVMTHEAHHLMQQEQSGVFGFYLLRYLPTSFKHGYEGHPDENFWKP